MDDQRGSDAVTLVPEQRVIYIELFRALDMGQRRRVVATVRFLGKDEMPFLSVSSLFSLQTSPVFPNRNSLSGWKKWRASWMPMEKEDVEVVRPFCSNTFTAVFQPLPELYPVLQDDADAKAVWDGVSRRGSRCVLKEIAVSIHFLCL